MATTTPTRSASAECLPLLLAALTGRSGHGLALLQRIRSTIARPLVDLCAFAEW